MSLCVSDDLPLNTHHPLVKQENPCCTCLAEDHLMFHKTQSLFLFALGTPVSHKDFVDTSIFHGAYE